MSGLKLSNVSRQFGGLHAVKGLSLHVKPGQITGLIGPNGAGKTTVINLIAGLLKLTSGNIHLDDVAIDQLPPHVVAGLGVARTFQNIRLLKEATVLDNIIVGCREEDSLSFIAQAVGLPSVRAARQTSIERAKALMVELGMTEFADRLAGELSYGHQRRVEMMRALALNPKILLLDEPVAGMNDIEAEELGRVFRKLAQRGIGILLIEHNMRFVMSLCDEVYVVASGELIDHGSPEAVRTNPRVIEAYLGGETC